MTFKEPIIVCYEENNDLLVDYFMSHPNDDIERYTAVELLSLEKRLRRH